MDILRIELVPYWFALFVYLLWPFAVAFSEPVASNAPVASSADTDSSRAIYDQRQTGKYNIHVSIKDVAIIDVDQNGFEDIAYGDDDYYYDESHLTVKPILLNPIKTTTQKQPNTTSSLASSTVPTMVEDFSTTAAKPNSTSIPQGSEININVTTMVTPINSIVPSIGGPKKSSQNVIILGTQNLMQTTQASDEKPSMRTAIDYDQSNARSNHMLLQTAFPDTNLQAKDPLKSIISRPYLRYSDETNQNNHQKAEDIDSKIYKFKVRRAHKQIPDSIKSGGAGVAYPIPYFHTNAGRRCSLHQYRDSSGDCRSKRSSSILKKLLGLLITLP